MFQQKKPYSAVTVTIEHLTSESYEEDDLSGIPDLVEMIKLQASGPTEAARAIRKKLKYGTPHRQLRALVLLDGLIQNAGPRFQRAFADEPLLERLRFCATSELSDPDVRKKCAELFRGWSAEYRGTVGMERIAMLYREMPRRKVAVTQERSRAVRESDNPFGDEDEEAERERVEEEEARERTEADAAAKAAKAKTDAATAATPPPKVSSHTRQKSSSTFSSLLSGGSHKSDAGKKDKHKAGKGGKGPKPFNMEAEKEQMKTTIAEASLAATDLVNSLQSINREKERVSENERAVKRFESCKLLRRRILRYIHHVESEQWLGGLLHANDELVTALMTFEQLDRSIDADSDSDDEIAEQAHAYRMIAEKGKAPSAGNSSDDPNMAALSISPQTSTSPSRPKAPPPRPSTLSKPSNAAAAATAVNKPRPPPLSTAPSDGDSGSDNDGEDENDPFADSNEFDTPTIEKKEQAW